MFQIVARKYRKIAFGGEMKLKYHYALSKDSYDVRHTSGSFSRELNFQVDSMGTYEAYQGYYTEREGMDTFLCIYTLKGRGNLIYQGETYALTEDTAVVFYCGEYQDYRTEGDGGWKFQYIHFSGSSADKYYKIMRRKGVAFVKLSNPIRFQELFRELERWVALSGKEADLRISNIMEGVFTEMMVDEMVSDGGTRSFSNRESILKAVRYIQENYNKEITIEKLSDTAALSKYHFIRTFKRMTGVAPYEYLKCYRMNESKKLLKETAYSISQISDMIGYRNVNVYIQNFKQYVGVTPLKYRKSAF